jgi:hypothetical protein
MSVITRDLLTAEILLPYTLSSLRSRQNPSNRCNSVSDRNSLPFLRNSARLIRRSWHDRKFHKTISSIFMGLPPQTCALVVIGASLTVGLGLFLGGSVAGKNYSALSALIPAALAALCYYGMGTTADPMSQQGWVSYDSWIFMFVFCLISTFGLPVVIAHVLGLGGTTMGLNIAGALVILIGFAIAQFMARDPSADGW